MRIDAKFGTFISGYVIKDAVQRETTKSRVTNFAVRYGEAPPEPGSQYGKGIVMNVSCWNALSDDTAGILKGDCVMVTGTVKTKPYQGKEYTSLRADAAAPGFGFMFRMIESSSRIAPTIQPPTDISSHELYPGEKLSDHAPAATPPADPLWDAPIVDDSEDLPF